MGDHQEHQDRSEEKDQQDQQDLLDQPDHQDHQEFQELQDHQDYLNPQQSSAHVNVTRSASQHVPTTVAQLHLHHHHHHQLVQLFALLTALHLAHSHAARGEEI